LTGDPGQGICLVLGAGGFRGLAHIGVLRGLRQLGIRVESVIGVSIGGLVASFHAGLGYTPEEMERRLGSLSTGSLLALGWSLHRSPQRAAIRAPSSRLLDELRQLPRLDLEKLHFGIVRLGLLALDLLTGEEIFAVTGQPNPVSPADVALGGASIPVLFPWVRRSLQGRTYRLVDGGLSHSLPVERALQPPFCARRVVAVDLGVMRGFRERDAARWHRLEHEHPGVIVRLAPRVQGAGTVFFRRSQAGEMVRSGEQAVLQQARALC
jgi:NTE family protein